MAQQATMLHDNASSLEQNASDTTTVTTIIESNLTNDEASNIVSSSFDSDLTIIENHKSRDGTINSVTIKVNIQYSDKAAMISIQEGTKGMSLVIKPSQFRKRKKQTLLSILRHYYPSCK